MDKNILIQIYDKYKNLDINKNIIINDKSSFAFINKDERYIVINSSGENPWACPWDVSRFE